MPATSLIIEKMVTAPPHRVWLALIRKEEMKHWYFELDDFKAEPGFEFRFYGKGHKGEQYLHLCKVLEVIPDKKIAYSWQYKGYPGYSVVSFELFEEGTGTRIVLTHKIEEAFPGNNPDFAQTSFTQGWTYLVTKSLPEYLAV